MLAWVLAIVSTAFASFVHMQPADSIGGPSAAPVVSPADSIGGPSGKAMSDADSIGGPSGR